MAVRTDGAATAHGSTGGTAGGPSAGAAGRLQWRQQAGDGDKGGDEQGAAGRGNDGDKERKRAEETTAAKGGEKNGDGKGRRRGEETTTAKGGEKNHAQRGRLFLGLVWQGTGCLLYTSPSPRDR